MDIKEHFQKQSIYTVHIRTYLYVRLNSFVQIFYWFLYKESYFFS